MKTKVRLSVIIASIVLLVAVQCSYAQCAQLDVVICADLSGSIEGSEQFVIDAVNAFVQGLHISENAIRFSVVTFNDGATVNLPLSGEKKWLGYVRAQGGTQMAHALYTASNELFTNGRPGVLGVVILISDGQPNDLDAAKAAAANLKVGGFHICTVGVDTGDADQQLLQELSSNGCYTFADYKNLVRELKRLDMCL